MAKPSYVDDDNRVANLGDADLGSYYYSTLTEKVYKRIYSDLTLPVDLPATSRDMFGRIVTADPHKLFEYSANYPLDTTRYWSTSEVGAGTVTRNTTSSQIQFYTSTASGDKAIMQMRRSIQYNKGNSQEVFVIFKPCAVENRRERWGYFDSNNGAFFEHDGTTAKIVIRSSTSGSPVDLTFSQSTWDDPLDGTGDSGLTIDWTKQSVFKIEIGWLSSRGIRFTIDVQGQNIVVYNYLVSNTLTVPFMGTANLPIRFEIENTGTVASANTSAMTCCAVQSSGSESQEGAIRALATDISATAPTVDTTERIFAGVRLKSAFLNGAVQPLDFEMLPISGNSNVFFKVVYNPTIVDGVWSSPSDGIVDTLDSYTSFSGGSILTDGFFPLSNKTSIAATTLRTLLNDIYLGRAIDDTRDPLVMIMRTDTSSGTIHFSGKYKEYA